MAETPVIETPVEVTETPVVEEASKETKKKKNKRVVTAGQVHIQATFNNTVITVTDAKGGALTASSAGACGFRGSKKGTAYAAQVASEKALNEAKDKYSVSRVEVFVKGIGLGRDSAIRALQNVDMMVESIKDVTPVPHGGVRPRKQRRV
jgi:small subunit ribosomal protein S11